MGDGNSGSFKLPSSETLAPIKEATEENNQEIDKASLIYLGWPRYELKPGRYLGWKANSYSRMFSVLE
jgi:hypothetical protein